MFVVGSLNLDFVVAVERLPVPGETVLGGDLGVFEGGKGANQAVAAARAGADVRFVGCVGGDDLGRRGLGALAAEGIDTRHLLTLEGVPTGVALIGTDAQGHNVILVSPGANARLTDTHVRAALGDLTADDIVLCQLEVPREAVLTALVLANNRGARSVLDPAPAGPGLESLVAAAWAVTPNEPEAAMLSGAEAPRDEPGFRDWAGRLAGLGSEHVVLTRGERGALWLSRSASMREIAPVAAQAVDTTAAGDAFNGALAAALVGGADLEDALIVATRYAARSVESRGAQASLPCWHWSEVLAATDDL
ncbi:MAG: ribokinase [Planctomycetota bacterium]